MRFRISEHVQEMHIPVQLVGIHHFFRAVVGKYLENIVATAMEVLESLTAVTLGDGIRKQFLAARLGRQYSGTLMVASVYMRLISLPETAPVPAWTGRVRHAPACAGIPFP